MITGFTCGSFDLCHAGHVLMFQECKEQCDRLIVGIQSDPSIDRPSKNKSIQTLEERVIQVKAIKYIDDIIIYHTEDDLYQYLRLNPPDIRFIGEDWMGKKYTGYDLPIKVIFNTRKHNYSSSELRKRIVDGGC